MDHAFERFFKGYISLALQDFENTLRDMDVELDYSLEISDILPESMEIIRAECLVFWSRNGAYIQLCADNNTSGTYSIEDLAGHDFWLTRNRHGAGFWSRPELWAEYKDKMTKDSEWFGESNLERDEQTGKISVF